MKDVMCNLKKALIPQPLLPSRATVYTQIPLTLFELEIPLAGIARVVGVSEPWLQSYVNEKYQSVPRQVNVQKKKGTFNHPV